MQDMQVTGERQVVWAKWLLVTVLVVGAFVVWRHGRDDGSRPGSAAVYEQIEAETDCATLQATFDRNMDRAEGRAPGSTQREWELAYAEAAQNRMRELACY